MTESSNQEPKTPGRLFIEKLIKSGAIKSAEDLTAEQMRVLSELNQSQDMIGSLQEDLGNKDQETKG